LLSEEDIKAEDAVDSVSSHGLEADTVDQAEIPPGGYE
jgi:hypothetical protein